MTFDFDKFKALVHYICAKAENPSVLGAVKLNKVLWYSESIFFMMYGEPITGETYVKRERGPVPRDVLRALDSLVSEGKIARGKVDHFGFMKSEFIAIVDADVDRFTSKEVSVIDGAFEHVCINHTARSISEETHGVVWQLAEIGEIMPLNTVFAANEGEITEDDLLWADREIAKYSAAA